MICKSFTMHGMNKAKTINTFYVQFTGCFWRRKSGCEDSIERD